MAAPHSTYGHKAAQLPKAGSRFLASVLDAVDDGPLMETLEAYNWTGRRGYPPKAMFRAYVVKLALKIRYNNQLLERLRGNRRLRELCGFGADVPSESALSRFFNRLSHYQDLLEQCIYQVTEKLAPMLPRVKSIPGQPDEVLPPLGEVLAIDGSVFASYGNGNRRSGGDPDAAWGFKHSAGSKGGVEYVFGYRMHLVSDASYGIPLGFTLTPANGSEFTQLPLVVHKVQAEYPWLHARYLVADRGYDSQEVHRFLVERGIIPVIHIRKPTANDGLRDGIYTAEGYPTCMGGVPMQYVRTDPETGQHLFRCRTDGCALKSEGTRAVTHCDTEVWERPEDHLRSLGLLPRFLPDWKRLYRLRGSVERIFRSLKHSRGLDGHCARGMRKVLLQATLSVLTYQATVLARLRAGDVEHMRHMSVRVA